MSEFFSFQDETEKKTISKFIEDDSSDDDQKKHKKDKKLDELQALIKELKPHELDSFVKNIKKYKNLFKNGLPDFLLKFFNENMQKCGKPLASKIKRIIEQYKTVDEFEVKVVEKNKTEESFQENLNCLMKDKDVIQKLDNLYLKSGPKAKLKINFVKIGIFNQEIVSNKFENYKIYSELIGEMVEILSENGNNDQLAGDKDNFSKNLPFFLSKLMIIMKPEKFKDFELLLTKLESKGYKINQQRLEFYYFHKKQELETEDNMFKLLFFVRKNDFISAKEQYLRIKDHDMIIDDRVLYELGLSAFKNGDFIFSFEIFDLIRTIDTNIFKLSLCAILGRALKENNFFQKVFSPKVKSFENKYLIPSFDPENEIVRLFFLIQKQRVGEANAILNKYLGVDIYFYLKETVLKELRSF